MFKNKNNYWLFLVFIFFVNFFVIDSFNVFADELTKKEKDTIFIGKIQVQDSVKKLAQQQNIELELERIVDSLDVQFINAINQTRVFQIVERKRKDELELEQAFASVAVNANDKNAAKALEFTGAKYVVLPYVDGFQVHSKTKRYDLIGRETMERKIFFSAVLQIVNTTTGELLPETPSFQLNRTENIDMTEIDQSEYSDQELVLLAKEMANKLSQDIIGLLRPAKVLSLVGNQILINRGTGAAFYKGKTVKIYAITKVEDEDTGEIFNNEFLVGQAKISRSDVKKSFGILFGDNFGVTNGCIVKLDSEKTELQDEDEQSDQMTPGSSEEPLKWE